MIRKLRVPVAEKAIAETTVCGTGRSYLVGASTRTWSAIGTPLTPQGLLMGMGL